MESFEFDARMVPGHCDDAAVADVFRTLRPRLGIARDGKQQTVGRARKARDARELIAIETLQNCAALRGCPTNTRVGRRRSKAISSPRNCTATAGPSAFTIFTVDAARS